jgi:5-(aminomethyl)-3-furanmethanol phosphate kinase
MIVVKLGGSLFDHPRLMSGLRAYLDTLLEPLLLVPGGGAVADAVRHLDAIHQLGEEASHVLALRAMSVTEAMMRHALRSEDTASRVRILDAFQFALDDECLPHSWAVTSDSIAARAAVVFGASRLVLLKSIDIPPETPWPEAAANGWVDTHFPIVIADAAFPVEVVNFRRQLEQFSHPA